MIGRLVLVSIVGVLFYIIIPALSQSVKQIRRKGLLKKLKSARAIFASCTDFQNGTMIITPVETNQTEAEFFTIRPGKTRFFMLEKEGTFEAISWKSVFLIRNGVTLSWYPGEKKGARGICLFHEEVTKKELETHIENLTIPHTYLGRIQDPIKYFSVALGAFLELCLFIESLEMPGMNQVSIAALVAVFGKALPYCPPGLFFTLAAQFAVNHQHGQRKSRRRAAVGFILITTGVILNIGVIFFAILKVGFFIS